MKTKLQDRINALIKYREDNKINETFEGQIFTSELEVRDTSCYWQYVKYGLEILHLINTSYYERYHKGKLKISINKLYSSMSIYIYI